MFSSYSSISRKAGMPMQRKSITTTRRLTGLLIGCLVGLCLSSGTVFAAEAGILGKIDQSGQVTVGLRESAIPFGYYDQKGDWVGFSVDMAKELQKALSKKFGKDIKLVERPVNPKTRIPLIANGTLDIVMGSSTHTLARDKVVDFTNTVFITGTQLLVPSDSSVKTVQDLAGKHVGAARGSTNAAYLQQENESGKIKPKMDITLFAKHSDGFLALEQGRIDAYSTDGILLAGLKAKAPHPDDWKITKKFLTFDPYAYIVPQNDSAWRDFVNTVLIHVYESGQYEKIYDKWFGPKGVVPYPMSDSLRTLLHDQAWPE